VVAGVAWQPWVLVAGRLLQGAGAGAFVPASLSLLTPAFQDEREHGRALGVYGSMAGLGFVVASAAAGGLDTSGRQRAALGAAHLPRRLLPARSGAGRIRSAATRTP
jgi:MFS family permease